MAVVVRTSQAETDLIEIWWYIAADNVAAADVMLDKLDEKSYLLAENPQLGQARPEITDELQMALS